MAEKLQFIQDIIDPRGNAHSILIYGKGDLRFGNKTFKSMADVKIFIETEFPALPVKKEMVWCRCGEKETFGSYPEDGQCDCGIHKHHVHCGTCGKVSQVG
jgi:hypothetical protein